MKVLEVGASGAIGIRLVPQLIAAGHEVIGTSRSPENADRVRAVGATPVALPRVSTAASPKRIYFGQREPTRSSPRRGSRA